MIIKKLILTSIISGVLFSCTNESTVTQEDNQINLEIEARISIPDSKASILLDKLKPKSQFFEFNGGSDISIIGKNGTHVYIPRNSFINEEGQTIKEEIDMELIEVLSVSDFIKLNLQTLSNGNLLQSEGMLFLDVKSNGQAVALAPEKKLQIELPKIRNYNAASDIRIFSGAYDSLGNINWSEKSRIDNKLIPLPLELFDFDSWISFGFKRLPNNDGYQAQGDDEVVDSLTFKHPSLENTFIATREFEERYRHIMSAEWAIGHYTSYYSTTVQTGQMIKDSTISKIYLNNLNKDLSYCDSLAYAYMKTWQGKAVFDSYWYSETETSDLLAVFKRFYEERLTTVIEFPSTIDLKDETARKQLEKKGFSEIEIDEILGAYERQQKIVESKRNNVLTRRITFNSFKTSQLGWINCDQFYNDPKSETVDLMAYISNDFVFATMSLVINGRQIALNGIKDEGGNYRFTGEQGLVTKLPIGEKAAIVGLSYNNNQVYLGIKEITIDKKGNYELDLTESSIEEVNEYLKNIN